MRFKVLKHDTQLLSTRRASRLEIGHGDGDVPGETTRDARPCLLESSFIRVLHCFLAGHFSEVLHEFADALALANHGNPFPLVLVRIFQDHHDRYRRSFSSATREEATTTLSTS